MKIKIVPFHDQVVDKLGGLLSNVGALEQWLAQAVASLKREGVEFDPVVVKDKIEKLYQMKAGKQKDLDKIKEIGKGLKDRGFNLNLSLRFYKSELIKRYVVAVETILWNESDPLLMKVFENL